MKPLPKQPNQSLMEGIRCLQGIVSANEPMGASQVARSLDIELTRAHRLLRTLSHMGLLRQNADRKYAAGPALPVLAAQAMQGSHLIGSVVPAMENLRKKTPHIVAFGVLWMKSVTYVYHGRPRIPSEQAIGGHEVTPAHHSGLGMALLARLPEEALLALYEDEPSPEGTAQLLKELAPIRKAGHAFFKTSPTTYTLSIVSSQPDSAIGISGDIAKSEVPGLLKLLHEASAEIDESSVH